MYEYADFSGDGHKELYIKTVFSTFELAVESLLRKLKEEHPDYPLLLKDGFVTINYRKSPSTQTDFWVEEVEYI